MLCFAIGLPWTIENLCMCINKIKVKRKQKLVSFFVGAKVFDSIVGIKVYVMMVLLGRSSCHSCAQGK